MAKEHLTGDFFRYYDNFAQQMLAPAAKQNAVRATATVVRAGASEVRRDSAVVLLFVNQTTSNLSTPDPILTASSIRVTLTKHEGVWRISSFDPMQPSQAVGVNLMFNSVSPRKMKVGS